MGGEKDEMTANNTVEKYKPAKALVTGGGGFLGGAIA